MSTDATKAPGAEGLEGVTSTGSAARGPERAVYPRICVWVVNDVRTDRITPWLIAFVRRLQAGQQAQAVEALDIHIAQSLPAPLLLATVRSYEGEILHITYDHRGHPRWTVALRSMAEPQPITDYRQESWRQLARTLAHWHRLEPHRPTLGQPIEDLTDVTISSMLRWCGTPDAPLAEPKPLSVLD